MKKKIIFLACMCMAIGLSSCATRNDSKVETEVIKEDTSKDLDESKESENQNENSESVETENNESDTENADNSLIKVSTNFFSVFVPKTWENDYIYEIRSHEHGSYSLSFRDKASFSQEGGWLFNIEVVPLNNNYKDNPSYEELGSITTSDGKEYNLIITEPTDVQFSDETAKSYREKKQLTEEICKSLKMENDCVFDENVKEISEVEYDDSEIRINTPYYSLNLHKLWVTDGFYEMVCEGSETYSLKFYNTENYYRGGGGSMFSIRMYEETEDTSFPSCKDLGKIKLSNGKIYKLLALFPTDVQYSSELATSYRNMEELRTGIIDSIVINEEYKSNNN